MTIQRITYRVSVHATWRIAISNLEASNELRLSWTQLLVEAVSNPGILHDAYSRFWNYSIGNQLLALIQCQVRGLEPGPLASFNRWKELGRHVKKGEKALTLCMPIQVKCRDWDERRREEGLLADADEQQLGFRTVFVYKRNWFVLSQTDGTPFTPEPLPAWDKALALGSLGIREEPFAMMDGNCQGYSTQRSTIAVSPIAVRPWKTTFHEIAHIVLGHVGQGTLIDQEVPEKALREVEAEAVALLCCESLRLEGVEFSRGYIQSWLGGGLISEKSAQRIMSAATAILKAGTQAKNSAESAADCRYTEADAQTDQRR